MNEKPAKSWAKTHREVYLAPVLKHFKITEKEARAALRRLVKSKGDGK